MLIGRHGEHNLVPEVVAESAKPFNQLGFFTGSSRRLLAGPPGFEHCALLDALLQEPIRFRQRRAQVRDGIGVSGSIAAIELPKVIRELIRHGADVQAVMSPEAMRLVTPETLEFATGHRPITQLTGNVEHVTLLGPGWVGRTST